MAGEGFEPSKAEPGDLQSPPIGRSGNPPSTHPLDTLTYGTTTENFDQNTKAYNLLMHHVRQAVVYMNDSNRQADRIMDIEWFLDRIREDLSAIAYFGDGSVPAKPRDPE